MTMPDPLVWPDQTKPQIRYFFIRSFVEAHVTSRTENGATQVFCGTREHPIIFREQEGKIGKYFKRTRE